MIQIRGKILAALMAVVLLMLAPTLYAVASLRQLKHITGELRESQESQLERQVEQLDQCETLESLFRATQDADYLRGARECAVGFRETAERISGTLGSRAPDLGGELRDAARLYSDGVLQSGGEGEEGGSAADGPPELRRDEQVRRLRAVLDDIQAREETFRAERTRAAEAVSARAVGVLWISLLLALAAAVLITSRLARNIVLPLRRLVSGTQRIAQGRFDAQMPVTSGDELGALTKAFNRMSVDLASLDRVKAEFLHMASHEFRSPVASILGHLEVLRGDGGAPPSAEERRQSLDQIVAEAELLSRHIDQFLDISRIEAGRLEMDPRALPAAPFFLHELEGFSIAARRDGIALRTEIASGLPAEIRVDPDRMGEVVRNLIENALGFTPAGGEVLVRLEGDDGYVRLEVKDSGPGIPADEVELVFGRYYRGSARRARGAKGSGLGLAISRAIVEAHGGRLWAESSPGEGGRFICRIPVEPPAREGEGER